jgi:hypothetical protein
MVELHRGQFIWLTAEGERRSAMVLLVSGNQRSVAVGFDGALHVGGGVYVGMLPLTLDDEGTYRDLIHGNEVTVEVRETRRQ